MRYNIKRWYEGLDSPPDTILKDCGSLEVVKQVIKAIDNAQNVKATVSGAEKEEQPYPSSGGVA